MLKFEKKILHTFSLVYYLNMVTHKTTKQIK